MFTKTASQSTNNATKPEVEELELNELSEVVGGGLRLNYRIGYDADGNPYMELL